MKKKKNLWEKEIRKRRMLQNEGRGSWCKDILNNGI